MWDSGGTVFKRGHGMTEWLLGFSIGVMILTLGGYKTWQDGVRSHNLIRQCEQTLPRDTKCVLAAKPEK